MKFRNVLACAGILTWASLAHLQAQLITPARSPFQCWTPEYLITLSSDLDRIKFESRSNPKKGGEIKSAPSFHGLTWGQDRTWSLEVAREGEHRTWRFYSRGLDDATWRLEGRVNVSAGRPHTLTPLMEARRFLAVAYDGECFTKDRSFSPVAVFRQHENGTLSLDHLVSFPTRKPLVAGVDVSKGPGRPPQRVGRWTDDYATVLRNRAPYPVPLVTPAGLVLVWPNVGFFWVLDPTNGRVKRCIQLFPSIGEAECHTDVDVDLAVLAVQPTREGTLLVATRAEDAVRSGPTAFDYVVTLQNFQHEGTDRVYHNQLKALQNWPELFWWHVDLEEGKVFPCPPPQRVPRTLGTREAYERFQFHFRPDGSLRVGVAPF